MQGNDVEFNCQATGDPAPSVTWLTGTSVNVELLNNDRIEVMKLHNFFIETKKIITLSGCEWYLDDTKCDVR